MSANERTTVASGFGYLEAARWHRGALWFSDVKHQKVHRMTADGQVSTVAEVPTTPSGLGFAPDASLLIVSMSDGHLLRLAAGDEKPVDIADLNETGFHPNDMAVDTTGRAYITHFGYDWFGGAEPKTTGIIIRHPDGRQELAGGGLQFPNGVAISADGAQLFVAESFGTPRTRLTRFDIRENGQLANQHVVAEFGPVETHIADGICVDVERGVWVALGPHGEFHRVAAGGTVTDVVQIPAAEGNYAVDSVLGGPDGRTLFMLIAAGTTEQIRNGFQTSARVETVRVRVPGATS